MKDGWSIIKGNAVMVIGGKVSWGVDKKGWSCDIYRIIDGIKVCVNNKLSVATFRRLCNEGKIVVE